MEALESVDLDSLKDPQLVSAVMSKDNNKYGLFVFWLEDDPSVNGIELSFESNLDIEYMPLSEIDLRECKRASKDTIVLGASFEWSSGSDIFSFLERGANTGTVKVRMAHKQKKSVSNWLPVKFF
jgi:hypothetical protein